jgi:hypothetical protein
MEHPERQASNYAFLDSLPDFYTARQEAKLEAYSIVEKNRQYLRDGEFHMVSMPVDALGTAKRVRNAAEIYGHNSEQYVDRFNGLVLDCGRLLSEAARKNTYEYFPLEKHEFNEEDQQYYSHGMQILAMTEAALTPVAEPEEVERRVNERVEEISYGIGRTALVGSVKIRTVSECTDWAIDALEGSSTSCGGYVPEIKKLMIRDVSYDGDDRFQEQIGVSGVYITHEVILEALEIKGVEAATLSKTELHGAQFTAEDDLIEFVALLDEVASEYSGISIFLGEAVDEDLSKDYSTVRDDAVSRQKKLEEKSNELAYTVLNLEAENVDDWAAVGIVEAKVKSMLLQISKQDSSIAASAFDKNTEKGIQEVVYLQAMGRFEEASKKMQEVEDQAPAPGYCGAGSCGLESLSSKSDDGLKAQEIGLDSSEGLIKDKERSCVKCHKKAVVYDLKGKKGCVNCGATARYK